MTTSAQPAPAFSGRDPLVWALYAATLVAALATLGRAVIPALDEGDYLAAARLVVEHGKIPYRDFAFAHPPFTTLAAGLVLKAVGWRMVLFDALYAAWCLCAVFPLARVARTLTGSRAAALVTALLFLWFPEFLRWDARFFALRQASLPLLAFALEALWVRRRPATAGVLLGLFGAGLVPHAMLAVLFGAAAIFEMRSEPREARRFGLALFATLLVAYGALAFIPDFWRSLLGFHAARERMPALARLARIATETLPGSAPLLLAGLLGTFLLPRRARPLAAMTLVGLPLLVFGPPPYHAHYLSSFGPPLALGAGALIAWAGARSRAGGAAVAALVAGAGTICSFLALREPLTRTTPELFAVVHALEKTPEPLLSFEPIYAMWARRDLTYFYAANAARYGPALGFAAFDHESFREVLARSNTVLLEPSLARVLTPERLALLQRDFVPVWRDRWNVVLVRR